MLPIDNKNLKPPLVPDEQSHNLFISHQPEKHNIWASWVGSLPVSDFIIPNNKFMKGRATFGPLYKWQKNVGHKLFSSFSAVNSGVFWQLQSFNYRKKNGQYRDIASLPKK